jgi:hypothetical protein
MAPCFILLITYFHGFFCKQQMFDCNLISNIIVLEDITYYFVGAGYPRGFLQLGIYLFRVLARMI